MITPPSRKDWDDDQNRVIQANANSRVIVDAGPGTGKTAVACARLAHLIENQDIEPTKVWMICFTRVAVAEIKERLQSYIGDNSRSIVIATIDSRAWAINSGFNPNAKLAGCYDKSIEQVINLMETEKDVSKEIERISHLVIDESQDIVGIRADMIEHIIKRINKNCGVTIFADEAQAIYDFSNNNDYASQLDQREQSRRLLDKLRTMDNFNFVEEHLSTIHRTSSPTLMGISAEIRSNLLDRANRNSDVSIYVRERINALAGKNDLTWTKLSECTLPNECLILFRTRAEALLFIHHHEFPIGVRISGYSPRLPAWLALCFYDYHSPYLAESEFLTRWEQRICHISSINISSQIAWTLLQNYSGMADGSVDMHKLRKILSRRRPPIDIVQRDFGIPGPVIGTIHGSKGREANHVILMLPKVFEGPGKENKVEESRVLFVGATRAKDTLWAGVSTASYLRRIKSGRVYRWSNKRRFDNKLNKIRKSISVEAGLDDDISARSLVGHDIFTMEEATNAQSHLAANIDSVTKYKLWFTDTPKPSYMIKSELQNKGLCVGYLTSNFRNDLIEIAKKERKFNAESYPKFFDKAYSRGCYTIVMAHESDESSTLHEPWRSSGFILAPSICAFPTFSVLV